MIETQPIEIEIVASSERKGDACIVPTDKRVQKNLGLLLDLDTKLSEPEKLNEFEWAALSMRHIDLWQQLPEYYKAVLAELSDIEMRLESQSMTSSSI